MKMININKVKFYTYCRVGSEEKKQKQKQIKGAIKYRQIAKSIQECLILTHLYAFYFVP